MDLDSFMQLPNRASVVSHLCIIFRTARPRPNCKKLKQAKVNSMLRQHSLTPCGKLQRMLLPSMVVTRARYSEGSYYVAYLCTLHWQATYCTLPPRHRADHHRRSQILSSLKPSFHIVPYPARLLYTHPNLSPHPL